jgi:hypothetical protein
MEDKCTKEMAPCLVSTGCSTGMLSVFSQQNSETGAMNVDGHILTTKYCLFYKIIHYDSSQNHYSLFVM